MGKDFYKNLYEEKDSESTKLQLIESRILRSTFKILLVENDFEVSKLNKKFLVKDGFKNITYVLSAEEALKYLETHEVHLILSDYRLGGKSKLNGYSLWSLIKQKVKPPRFMMISGFTDFETRELEKAGVRLLTKPYAKEDLNKMVRAFYLKHLINLKV